MRNLIRVAIHRIFSSVFEQDMARHADELRAELHQFEARLQEFREESGLIKEQLASVSAGSVQTEENRAALQHAHDELQHRLFLLETDLEAKLKQLETVTIPATAYYQARKVNQQPVIFEDRNQLVFECDSIHTYNLYVRNKSVLDDPKLERYLQKTVHVGDVIVDIGANIGGVAILCGKLVEEKGKVYAIEAEKETYNLLQHNVELNRMADRIESFHFAAYSTDVPLTLNIFPREASAWNTLGWFTSDYEPVGTETVMGVSLDTFCNQHGIGQIDILKIDVEGAEPEVLAGAANLLASRQAKRIIFEISKIPLQGLRHQVSEVIEPLLVNGYTIRQISDEGSLAPISAEEIQELFFANLVAILED